MMYCPSIYLLYVDISMHCAAGVVGDIGLVVRHPTMHDVGKSFLAAAQLFGLTLENRR